MRWMTGQALLQVEEDLVRPLAERLCEHEVGQVSLPGGGQGPVESDAITRGPVVAGQETVSRPARAHGVRGGRSVADPEEFANGFHGSVLKGTALANR